MRKRNLRAISLLLAGVMSLGLFAGCSKDGGDKKDPGKGGGAKDSIVIATMSETPSLSHRPQCRGRVLYEYPHL